MLRGRLSRGDLLSTGARRGAALLVAGGAFGALAETASADPLSDNDLAFARLLVGAELLSVDFYTRAMNAQKFKAVGHKYIRTVLGNEQDHYRSVGGILSGAGYTPATADDFEFTYPKGSFATRVSIAKLGRELETLVLGSYLGAVAGVQAQILLQPLARIGASEAQHLTMWGLELGGHPVSNAFPAPLTIDQVSDAMDAYTA
jgi:Ferritin-like domain